MPKKLTCKQIKKKASQFINCYNNNQIEHLLKLPRFSLVETALNKAYYYFKIPKAKGGFREIEAPTQDLKKTQRRLNEYLQYVYYNVQTEAAYGFIINPRKQIPKNIVSNAQKHLGNDYLLNIDFDDFFHQISKKEVFTIFKNAPFYKSNKVANLLAKICTNKQRLPMGAPTSPVLSNFACIDLDKELQNWAKQNNITYTRFVDDLSFSSKQKITQEHYQQINKITDKHQFKIDMAKTKWFIKKQIKQVTGLVLGNDKIEIPPQYLTELDKDLHRLQKTIEVQIITGNIHKSIITKKFKQEIMGKINFIAVVMGYDSDLYTAYLERYDNAINPPEKEQLSLRWMHFSNYENF